MCHSYMIFSNLTATTCSIHPINSTHRIYICYIKKNQWKSARNGVISVLTVPGSERASAARPWDDERGVGNFQIWGAAGEGAVDAVWKRPVNRIFAYVATFAMAQ